jgi:hypothetical protein
MAVMEVLILAVVVVLVMLSKLGHLEVVALELLY